jgi:LmbE family N-acetylglucosaminyl deacetylase
MAAHLYLSPHLDDAIFSLGGLMAMQDARGEPISILTAFAGDPPDWRISPFAAELHARWGKAGPPMAVRRAEDRLAAGRLGASVVHLQFPEAIYRIGEEDTFLYPDVDAIFGPVDPQDNLLLQNLLDALGGVEIGEAAVYCPLGIGGHVDHLLLRNAAEMLNIPLVYYREFPYTTRSGVIPEALGEPPGTWRLYPLTEEILEFWTAAITEYGTQLSTFWEDEQTLFEELHALLDDTGGIMLLETSG